MAAFWENDADLDETLSLLLPITRIPTDEDSSSGSNSGNETTIVQLKRRNVNLSRERQRKELIELRRVVVEMEKALHTLKQAPLRSNCPLRSQCSTATALDRISVWKGIAMRQLQSRQRSELINRKLRRALLEQDRLAHNLMTSVEMAERSQQLLAQLYVDDARPTIESAPLYDRLQARALQLASQWELPMEVFKSAPQHDFSEMHVLRRDAKEVVLEIHSSSTHPFSVERLGAALWAFWSGPGTMEDDYTIRTKAHQEEDRIKSSVRVLTSKGGMDAVSLAHGLRLKYYCGKGEFGIVSTAQGLSHDRCGSPDDHALMSRDQWFRIVPGHSKGPSPVSTVQYVVRGSVELSGDPDDHPGIDHFTRMLRNIMLEEIRCALDAAERELIRSPLKRARSNVPALEPDIECTW